MSNDLSFSRDPKLNLFSYPNEELSRVETVGESATQQLLEMFKKQKLEELESKRAE